jgi:hypothetical protein
MYPTSGMANSDLHDERSPVPFHLRLLLALVALALTACSGSIDGSGYTGEALSASQRSPRYARIRDSARARGIGNAYLLAGIAMDETGLAQCWSEATWACQGPGSPDCGGGPVIAGSADGPCGARQGGLGMFQFDSGTYTDTLNTYGNDVLTVDGQVAHAIDYVVNMVKISAYTTNAETDDKARAWINGFNPNDGTLRDQWIRTVVRYYNGCQPGWSCWSARYGSYSDGLAQVLNDTGGAGFWAGASCDDHLTVGAIRDKYLALGGCGSPLGAPTTEERPSADGVGRYNDFQNGAIYWTPKIGAFEIHGDIHAKWASLGWETGLLGYPITDETGSPDGVGRYSVFDSGSIYWTPSTGAHEVHGAIRDKYKDLGWEAGPLGYPTSDEYPVSGGRRSDFQHGSITWDASSHQLTVATAGASAPPASSAQVLNVTWQGQQTGYWCGPGSTRMALSTRLGGPPAQQDLASFMGTTTNGTDDVSLVRDALNHYLATSSYQARYIADPPTQAQHDLLGQDVAFDISRGYPLVANVVSGWRPPGYPAGTIYHYVAVVGWDPGNRRVLIADPAGQGAGGSGWSNVPPTYWISLDDLAVWIGGKGYTA